MDFTSIYSVLLMVAGICIIIFVHELGHFLVAKWADVKVEVFSLCFGPTLFQKRIGETVYKICAIPLGGYVKMTGENPGDETTGDPREFIAKSVGARAAIISAGVIMNILFACTIFPVVFSIGVKMLAPVVGTVRGGLPAWSAGLQQGDRILSLNDHPVHSFEDIQFEVALADGPVKVDFERKGKTHTTQVNPEYDEQRGFPVIGISPGHDMDVFVKPKDGKEVPGLEGKCRLVSLNGKSPEFILEPGSELENQLLRTPEDLVLGIEKDGIQSTVRIEGKMVEAEEWFLGVRFLESTRIKAVRQLAGKPALNLSRGDRIIRVNSRPVITYEAFKKAVIEAPEGPVDLMVERIKDPDREPITISVQDLSNRASREEVLLNIVFEGSTVIEPLKEFSAAEAGFLAGDRIVKINATEVSTVTQVRKIIQAFDPKKYPDGYKFTVERDVFTQGKQMPVRNMISILATPRKRQCNEARLMVEFSQYYLQEVVKFPFPESVTKGLRYTGIWVYNIFNTLKSIFTGRVSPKNLGGIITIGRVSYDSAQKGLVNLLYFLAILSVNLAIINLLPIPILDGGHLMFLLVEKIKGSPVSDRVIGVGHAIGLCIILALILFVTFNDIQRWIFP